MKRFSWYERIRNLAELTILFDKVTGENLRDTRTPSGQNPSKLIVTAFWNNDWSRVYSSLTHHLGPEVISYFDASWATLPRRGIPSHIKHFQTHRPLVSRKSCDKHVWIFDIEDYRNSILSSYKSLFRNDLPDDNSPLFRHYGKRVNAKISLLANAFESEVERLGITEVYIPNGRLPHEVALTLVARNLGLGISFFELGWSPSRFYLAPERPQDLASLWKRMSSRKIESSPDLISESNDWFLRQRSRAAGQNPFIQFATHTFPNDAIDDNTKIIFLSSQDEFAPREDGKPPVSQEKLVLGATASALKEGHTVVIKTHPNALTKSRAMFRRELRFLSRLNGMDGVSVVPHTADLELESAASVKAGAIVLWSTAGLQFAYEHGHVTCLTESMYSPWFARFEEKSSNQTDFRSVAVEVVARKIASELPLSSTSADFAWRRPRLVSSIELLNYIFLLAWRVSFPFRGLRSRQLFG